MKHFMDIQNLIENATELKASNAGGFEVGDHIQITEKWDGSNASVQWDPYDKELKCFSRTRELTFNNGLNGFWEYVQNLPEATKDIFKSYPHFVVFGEWGNKNKIVYNKDNYKKWYVYDIYDLSREEWLEQPHVKAFAYIANLTYIHELYDGPFISWEHCKSFMNSPAYGDRQEGIVVKNQDKINNPDNRLPFYLKIVNEDFKETMKVKEVDPALAAARSEARALAATIVTKNRVEKMLYKLRDEQLIPEKLAPEDMGKVAKVMPKRIYEDCIKEEPETVNKVNEFEGTNFGKVCGSLTMELARQIICN
jgi:hypothetical protein